MSKYETGEMVFKDDQMYVCTTGLSNAQKKRLIARRRKQISRSTIQFSILLFNRKHRDKLFRCTYYGDRYPRKYRQLYKDVLYFKRKQYGNL